MDEFDEIFNHIAAHTLLCRARLISLYGFSRYASKFDGDIAEVGSYRGGSSVLLARANPHKLVHVFDTFAGIPNATAQNDVHFNGDFDLAGNVPSILTAEKNIEVHQGFFRRPH